MQFLNIRPKIGQKIVTQENMPKEEVLCQQAGESPAIPSSRCSCGHHKEQAAETCDLCALPDIDLQRFDQRCARLGRNAIEAQRLTYSGRSMQSLREAKTFNDTELEKTPLFENAKRQGGLF